MVQIITVLLILYFLFFRGSSKKILEKINAPKQKFSWSGEAEATWFKKYRRGKNLTRKKIKHREFGSTRFKVYIALVLFNYIGVWTWYDIARQKPELGPTDLISWGPLALNTALLLIPIIFRFGFPNKIGAAGKRLSRTIRSDKNAFGIWLGKTTGTFADLKHHSNIRSKQDVVLGLQDAAQNILVLGGIGGGKTTRAVQPMLLQLLDQECGGLIFDIKADFKHAVGNLASQTGREVVIIGPEAGSINLLFGLTPEVAASFLKSAYLLAGPAGEAPFWVDTATELSRNALGVLYFVPEHYSLNGLYKYIFNEEFKAEIDDRLITGMSGMPSGQAGLLRAYMDYQEYVFDMFEERTKSNVKATLAKVLSQFNHPDLVRSFCSEGEGNISIKEVLNGSVFLVDLPLAIWGLAGKTVYTLIKLRFFNLMQSRNIHPDWDQDRPVFFMCDEYQEVVACNLDGLSDLNFWDKSRSSKCIGIISGQSISSFYAAIGKRDLAEALLQNFRQKLCFRTEDRETLRMFQELPGKVYRDKVSTSKGDFQFGKSQTFSQAQENVLNPQLFRNLTQDQMVAFLSIQGQSWDDVLVARPVFV